MVNPIFGNSLTLQIWLAVVASVVMVSVVPVEDLPVSVYTKIRITWDLHVKSKSLISQYDK